MKKNRLVLLVFFLCLGYTTVFAQDSHESKKVDIQNYLTEEKLKTEVKEFFVRQIRKTDKVKEIDNHDFVHFCIDKNAKSSVTFLQNKFEGKVTITKAELMTAVDELLTDLAYDFKQYQLDNPKPTKNQNTTNPTRHYDLFDLGNPSNFKGPGEACNNPDFETGDATGWELSTGEVDGTVEYSYINVTPTTLGGSTQHTIMTGAGVDAIGGFPVVNPDGGNFSLMLGDGTGTNYSGADASQTFMVDANSAAFSYSYAIVLNDAGHTAAEQPYFKVNMYDQNGDPISCGEFSVVAGGSGADPDFVAYADGVYMPWRTTFAPLDAYIGQNVTIEFVVGDCGQGGHYGYAYLDASCQPAEILGPDTITCEGPPTISAPPGAASYLWNTGETTESIVASTPGTYEVTVTPVTGAGCAIILEKEVYEFIDTVTAVFTAVPTTICAGQSINFTDQSFLSGLGTITGWDWDFDGDGTVDNNTQSPSHTYNTPGTYDVNLTVHTPGCQDDTVVQVVVEPTSTANFTATTVCIGQTTDFTDASSAGVDTWNWDFDNDGTVDNTTQNPIHTFPAAGTYPVNLEVSVAGSCTHDTTINVIVGPAATASFTAPTVCLGVATNFTDASSAGVDTWGWDFDNDGTVDDATQNPSHTFPAAGTYPVNLEVSIGGSCAHDTTIDVTVNQSSIAIFSSTTVCLGVATDFTDASLGGVDTWAWDFNNDGTPDDATQNPSYTFPSSGTFPVNLEVSVGGVCTHDTTINVTVNQTSVANFSPLDVCLGMPSNFTDLSVGGVDTWAWDFDNDGTVDDVTQNPSHTFPSAGSFPVTLEVSVGGNCAHDTTINVNVNQSSTANFTPQDVCLGVASEFTDISIGGVDTWAWDFDNDGTIDDVTENPTHTFPTAGTYPVSLEVSVGGSCVHDTTIDVTVNPNPIAAFTFSDECFGSATGFTDQSNGNGGTIDTWAWDFTNNGTVDNTTENPSNGYSAAGNYVAELLIVTTDGCKDSTTVNVDVDAIPVANFGATTECLGNITTFTDSSTVNNSNVVQWSWDFGDVAGTSVAQNPTYTYTGVGSYNVSLTATSDSGCINTVIIPVNVSPNPIANFTTDTACSTYASIFTDVTTLGLMGIETWEWDFDNNGTVDNGTQNPTNIFAGAGTYPVGLNVIDSVGCSHDTILNVIVSENPIAAFTFSDECFGTNTTFTNQSLDNGGVTPIDTWSWDFDGDGVEDDNVSDPTFLFTSSGTYSTQLIVSTSLGCKDSTTVVVDVDDVPVANFGGTNECLGNLTIFTDSSSVNIGNINQWDWNFGDGIGTSVLQNPTYTYTTAGIKNVTLTVYSDSGCTHTFNTNVEVYANPIANFTPDTVCNSAESSFIDISNLGSVGIETWDWDFDNNGSSDDVTQNPTYTFSGAGDYLVNLNVVDSFGCTHDTTKTVTVSENPIADFTFSSECFGTGTAFTDLSLNNGGTTTINSYEWDFDGDGVIDNSTQNPNYVFTSAGSFNTELFVSSALGCKDSITISVNVNPIPVANFGLENVCLNTEGTFNDSSTVVSGSIASWDWDFQTDGTIDDNNQSPTFTYLVAGVYNVTLTVTTDSACSNTIVLPVEVYPNPTANFDTTDVCLNVAAQFTDQSNGNGGTIDTWEWDFDNDGTVDNITQNPNYNYSSDGTYNVELVISTVSGCKDTLMKTVSIYPMPTADFTFVNSCFMDSVEFTDNSNVTSGTVDQWQWSFGNTQTSNVQSPSEYYTNEGSYNVELIVTTNNNCSDTIAKSNIEVWPLPVVDFSPTAVCLNETTQFEDLSTVSNTYTANNNVQWDWNFGNALGMSSDQNPTYAYPVDGVYNATLIVTTDNNCVDSITKPVTVNPLPIVDFVADITSGCTPVEVNFTDLTTLNGGDMSTSTWAWDFNGDGNMDLQSQNPLWQFTNPSNSSVRDYDITLTVTSEHGCVGILTKSDYINAYPIPLASFSFAPNEVTIVDKEVTFTDQSIIASSWQWDLGDGTQTTVTHPIHEYADTGFYWVTLNIANEYGCTDSTAKLIRINPIYAIWIPNAFTPNGDNTNDYFYVDGYGIKELQVQIYDRWGLQLYDGIGLDQSWDGTYKGKLVQLDVYVYKVRAKDVFDEWHDYIGKVTVVE
ncbi:PKD domain-containing protein [Vicingus serpentipes]|uniref:PKD domain-containing protein n=1 Tax=Vicingus serpentipes TaxID=1926625 RepID=A0A5C6RXI7_9FLAO|nr:PKD domain-containing protein [Vicingus serpentipes]TXB67068.1 PKD domain-containing protein [Vicingus serpentipes]